MVTKAHGLHELIGYDWPCALIRTVHSMLERLKCVLYNFEQFGDLTRQHQAIRSANTCGPPKQDAKDQATPPVVHSVWHKAWQLGKSEVYTENQGA